MNGNHPTWTLALLSFVLFAGCAARTGPKPREANAEVLLVSFGGTNGELKDCGCHANPRGGLPHRESLVDSLRAENKDFLLVDLGDFMNNETVVGELKTRFIWQKMEEMGYRASAPGAREIAGWPLYQDLLARSAIRSVATNLTVIVDGKETPAGLPYLIQETHGVRVGFFSLIGLSILSSAGAPEGVRFHAEDPIVAATRTLAELRGKADIVVLMSQMPGKEAAELITKVPGIDIALYGRQPAWIVRAQKLGGTIVQETGIRGMYLGELALVVDPAGRIVEWGSRNDGLDATYGEKGEVVAQIRQIEDQSREMITVNQQKNAMEIGRAASGEKPMEKQP